MMIHRDTHDSGSRNSVVEGVAFPDDLNIEKNDPSKRRSPGDPEPREDIAGGNFLKVILPKISERDRKHRQESERDGQIAGHDLAERDSRRGGHRRIDHAYPHYSVA